MGSGEQSQPVIMTERIDGIFAEEIPSAPCGDGPSFDVFGIGPQKFTHDALLGNFLKAVDFHEIVDHFDVGGESSVYAKNLIIDYGCDGEVVEDIGEGSPDVEGAVLSDALVVEAVDLGDEAGLVVASQQCDSVFVADLQGQQHQEGFDAVSAPVHVVSQEDVVGVGRVAADFEEFEQVVELSVDISADGDWRLDSHSVGFFAEYFLGDFAEFLDGGFLYFFSVLELLYNIVRNFPGAHLVQSNNEIILGCLVICWRGRKWGEVNGWSWEVM